MTCTDPTPVLDCLLASDACVLYRIEAARPAAITELIASTAESRQICNEPCTVGLDYTRLLQRACARVLRQLPESGIQRVEERETIVLHILRGGLNFGLREALGDAFGWNVHGSAFLSAQRARCGPGSEDWHITESAYRKVHLPATATVILGDVVATGTSLRHALQVLLDAAAAQGAALRSLLLFTVGGPAATTMLGAFDALCRERFPGYQRTVVVYLEGRFAVPDKDTPLAVKITGTDLVRRGALLAPEFLTSQYESPAYPLERCVIYDAGSRACQIPEYAADVEDYWQKLHALARRGLRFDDLLAERCPGLDAGRFGPVDLVTLAAARRERLRALC